MTHTIRRQYLHLNLQGSEAEGFALQNRLSALCEQWLRPAMEQVLDRCAPAHGRLCIEHLEVDAGHFRLDHLERDLAGAVAVALEKALLELIPPGEALSRDQGSYNKKLKVNALAESSTVIRDQPTDGQPQIRLKTDPQTALETLVYFLENGRLPWSFRLPPGIGLETYLLAIWEKEPIGSSMISQMVQVLRAPLACRRLVLQFSAVFWEKLLQDMSPQAYNSVRDIRAMLRTASVAHAAPPVPPVFEKRLWETAFGQVARGGSIGATALVALVLAALPEAIVPVLPRLKELIGTALPTFLRQLREAAGTNFAVLAPPVAAQWGAWFGPLSPEISSLLNTQPPLVPTSAEIHPAVASVPDQSNQEPRVAHPADGSNPLPHESTAGGPANCPPPSKQELLPGHPIDAVRPSKQEPPASRPADVFAPPTFIPEEGLYVDNAGLVVLHPFLQMCFEGLGLARDGVLLQPDRALHLLHYLCTGHTPAPEYELTLPKILCNIPLDTPVEADITLTDQEKEEALGLLQAVIRWWTALQGTSPDALRGTFLCRPGLLSRRTDGDWLLQVEHQSFDILLAELPWGIAAVRLPWMEAVVWVEWG